MVNTILGLTLACSLACLPAAAQKKRPLQYASLAITNNQTAFPFGSFSKLATGQWHPGVELGTGFNWRQKPKHQWYQEGRLGYFNHQFVQHALPLYTTFGYRYLVGQRWALQAGLGGGALFSLPHQQRYQLTQGGNYEPKKGIRLQGMAVVNLGLQHTVNPQAKHPLSLFTVYQQRLQMPYVPSYVPLLPYNSLQIGVKYHLQPVNAKS
ncbi:MAG TPA: hypothetical protein PKD90_07575 [Phnomibacter sp.]|nr:hypothetical protein [Phnomibacter sp.]